MEKNKVSFSMKLKREMLSIKAKNKVEALSELYGIVYSKNDLNNENIVFKTELIYIINRIKENLKIIDSIDYTITKHNNINIVSIKNFKDNFNDLNNKWVLRGFFISSGYIKNPNKGHSLDFFVDYENSALKLYEILKDMGIKVLMSNKKNTEIVYVRNSENILDVVIKLDAINTFFEYEEITINKEINLKISRSINYEIANEMKKLNTSNKQVKMIEQIDKHVGISKLSHPLQELAKLRLKYQEISLQELATKLNITKSGVRSRFRRLQEVYEKIGE
ncbi:DNA-binding protein WhiA [Oceanivirga salmonicida]|uniref:DNA-binding protein WhiA n=1 Tax=Oceanivirga salmonicida TaxID=1769291 RepID=UPI000834FAF6|nr:DNA-binding protein WhiA [Oceanivirga salmonicida]